MTTKINYLFSTDDIFVDKFSANDIFCMLLPFYESIIRKYQNKFYAKGYDKEDLYQQGLIGLYNAILSFDNAKNKNFFLFRVDV